MWRGQWFPELSGGTGRNDSTEVRKLSAVMTNRYTRWFFRIAGVALAITGVAKIITFFGKSGILDSQDPLLGFPFRDVLLAVGIIELIVAAVCLFKSKGWPRLCATLIALLSVNFLAYRIIFKLTGWHRTCGCLGNLTDVLHIPPEIADDVMKALLAFLLVGSSLILFQLRFRKQIPPVSPSGEASALT
jgi:hypothetical protein